MIMSTLKYNYREQAFLEVEEQSNYLQYKAKGSREWHVLPSPIALTQSRYVFCKPTASELTVGDVVSSLCDAYV